ncbi:MAG: S-layer homology domain-containing protein [Eubacteriales bacterium]
MKKPIVLLSLCAILATAVFATDGDSLISLSYIQNIYTNSVKTEMKTQSDDILNDVYSQKKAELEQYESGLVFSSSSNQSGSLLPMNFYQNDIITIQTGSIIAPTLGSTSATISGVLINLTTGSELSSGTLSNNTRYLVAEGSSVTLKVQTGLAQIAIQGGYELQQSATTSHHFSDVSLTDWYNQSVTFVSQNDLFHGNSEHTFSPDTTMNRAMITTVLYRLAGSPQDQMDSATATFVDVTVADWFEPYVRWGATQKIASGMENNQFFPYNNLTQQQIFVMLYAFARDILKIDVTTAGDLSAYSDGDQVADWALVPTIWATQNRLLDGIPNTSTTLNPTTDVSRGFVATVLMNFSQRFQ